MVGIEEGMQRTFHVHPEATPVGEADIIAPCRDLRGPDRPERRRPHRGRASKRDVLRRGPGGGRRLARRHGRAGQCLRGPADRAPLRRFRGAEELRGAAGPARCGALARCRRRSEPYATQGDREPQRGRSPASARLPDSADHPLPGARDPGHGLVSRLAAPSVRSASWSL